MLALIFAAGLGTRLRPLTDTMPKALVTLAGHSLLEYQILKLKAAGIMDIIINVHHFPDMIINYLRQHDNFGCNVMISDERNLLLDTGGGLLKAWQTFAADSHEPILALNVDILSTIRLEDVFASYNSAEAGVLVVKSRQTQRYLCFDNTNRLIGWTNTATGEYRPALSTFDLQLTTKLAFSGMQILSPDVLPMLQEFAKQNGPKFSVIDFYLSALQNAVFRGFEPQGELLDVGKIDHLSEAETFAASLNITTKCK
ncbi:MAG: NTP transferase domain-containing protein [Paludibacteraceae bacterium]|nr:NTP transferase domain-containing protein [Paludibacteraceae bacterium]